MPLLDNKFAAVMRHKLIISGESVEELAGRIGIGRSTLYRYLHGDRTPKLSHAASIADALGFASYQLRAFLDNGSIGK